MFTIFKSKRRQSMKSLENKLYRLVENKERETKEIDEYGRDIVIALRERLDDFEHGQRGSVRKIISEAQRYIRENQHYLQ